MKRLIALYSSRSCTLFMYLHSLHDPPLLQHAYSSFSLPSLFLKDFTLIPESSVTCGLPTKLKELEDTQGHTLLKDS